MCDMHACVVFAICLSNHQCLVLWLSLVSRCNTQTELWNVRSQELFTSHCISHADYWCRSSVSIVRLIITPQMRELIEIDAKHIVIYHTCANVNARLVFAFAGYGFMQHDVDLQCNWICVRKYHLSIVIIDTRHHIHSIYVLLMPNSIAADILFSVSDDLCIASYAHVECVIQMLPPDTPYTDHTLLNGYLMRCGNWSDQLNVDAWVKSANSHHCPWLLTHWQCKYIM